MYFLTYSLLDQTVTGDKESEILKLVSEIPQSR
jgi:hypothetical protein